MSIDRIKQLIEMIESDNFVKKDLVINEAIENLELDRETLENIFDPEKNKLSVGYRLLKTLGVQDGTATGLLSQLQADRIEIDDIVDSVLGSRNYLILTGNLNLDQDKGTIGDFSSPFNKVMDNIYKTMKDNSILYGDISPSSLRPRSGYDYNKINDNNFDFKLKNSDALKVNFNVDKNRKGKNELKDINSIELKREANQDANNFNEVYKKLKDFDNKSGYWESTNLVDSDTIKLKF